VATLKRLIIRTLEDQGFTFTRDGFRADVSEKDAIRQLHGTAIAHKRQAAEQHLAAKEDRLLDRFAEGRSISPESIVPRLQLVRSGTEDELLFRYACLHWSIPISTGYGRRLRFLVLDQQNDKLIGLIGLGDPVFSLSGRDAWVGWDHQTRRSKLRHVMDAFVLGAVPPYSFLLGGKLVAMLAASNEVRHEFYKKYHGSTTIIEGANFDGRLALLTTTSALGRSSVYNRLRHGDRLLYQPVGWTQGSGEFHFANGLYGQMVDYAKTYCEPTAKRKEWGQGFRNRREIVKRCLQALDLPSTLLYHGIKRQTFVVPLAKNSAEFLRGEHVRLLWYDISCREIGEYCKNRWVIPRAQWDERYTEFEPRSLRLWQSGV
jgi:hypothetical protein